MLFHQAILGPLKSFFTKNSFDNYVSSVLAFVISYLILYFCKVHMRGRIIRFFSEVTQEPKYSQKALDMLGRTFLLAFPIYLALTYLHLPKQIENVLQSIFLGLLLYYAVKILNVTIHTIFQRMACREEAKNPNFDFSAIQFAEKLAHWTLWSMAGLIFISNLGYDLSAVLAGVGVGGVAVSFALQNVLADIFASISIYLDKPFHKGDFIQVDNDSGTVEHIGIKSTRIRTAQGEELILCNKELTSARIHNFGRMKTRRVISTFGIAQGTPVKKLKEALELMKTILLQFDSIQFERVHFVKFGEYQLMYELCYVLDTSNYIQYLDVQQEVNFKIIESFNKTKIELAIPTNKTWHAEKQHTLSSM